MQGAVRRVGEAWQAPVDLSAGDHALAPQVAVDARGNAIAVWNSFHAAGSRYIIQAAMRRKSSDADADAHEASVAVGTFHR